MAKMVTGAVVVVVRERGGGESDQEQREQSKDRYLQLRHLRREEREHSVIRQIISSVCSVLCESRRGEERKGRSQHTLFCCCCC